MITKGSSGSYFARAKDEHGHVRTVACVSFPLPFNTGYLIHFAVFSSLKMKNLMLREILSGINGYTGTYFLASSAELVLFPTLVTCPKQQPTHSIASSARTLYHIPISFISLRNPFTTIFGTEEITTERENLSPRRLGVFRCF